MYMSIYNIKSRIFLFTALSARVCSGTLPVTWRGQHYLERGSTPCMSWGDIVQDGRKWEHLPMLFDDFVEHAKSGMRPPGLEDSHFNSFCTMSLNDFTSIFSV